MASNMADFYETWNLSLLSSKKHIKMAKLNLVKFNSAKLNSFYSLLYSTNTNFWTTGQTKTLGSTLRRYSPVAREAPHAPPPHFGSGHTSNERSFHVEWEYICPQTKKWFSGVQIGGQRWPQNWGSFNHLDEKWNKIQDNFFNLHFLYQKTPFLTSKYRKYVTLNFAIPYHTQMFKYLFLGKKSI